MSMTYRAISSAFTRQHADRQVPTIPAVNPAPEPQPFGRSGTLMCSPWEGLYLVGDPGTASSGGYGREAASADGDQPESSGNNLDHFLASFMYGE